MLMLNNAAIRAPLASLQRVHSHTGKQKLSLLALTGLLVCNICHAGQTQTFDGANTPSDYTSKLLTIRNTPKSLGPIQRSELGAKSPSQTQDALLDQRHSHNTVNLKSGNIAGSVYGASPSAANIRSEKNTVLVTGGEIKRHIYGTYSSGSAAPAIDNSVTVNGGQIHGAVFGAYASANQAHAQRNTVTINGGMMGSASSADSRSGNIYGGYAANDTAQENHVAINGKEVVVRGSVFGGASRDGLNLKALKNRVTLTAGTVAGQVVGGIGARAAGGEADGNTVAINGNEAHIKGEIRGGTGRNATNNTVHITAGTIAHDVIGGYNTFGTLRPGTPKMLATGNKIIIEGKPDFAARMINGRAVLPALYGGFSTNPDPKKRDVLTGNILEIRTSGVTLRNAHNFEQIHFHLPTAIQADDTVLTLTDTAGADLSQSKISIDLPAGASLKKGQRITLILASAGKLISSKKNGPNDFEVQSSSKSPYTFKLTQEGNRLFATVVSDGSAPSSHPQAPFNRDTRRRSATSPATQ